MKYAIKAYANLRHYFGDKEEEQFLEAETPLTVGEIIEALAIPRPEIMLVKVSGGKVGDDHEPTDGATIELFPILAGG